MAKKTLDIREILRLIPHRWPFVMIDRVTECEDGGDTLTAIKNVTYNEAHFPGHFPAVPTMPGVLILEAMAQACGILAVMRAGHPGRSCISPASTTPASSARWCRATSWCSRCASTSTSATCGSSWRGPRSTASWPARPR